MDYPGEWLLDLPMAAQGFAEWSKSALARCGESARASAFAGFLDYIRGLDLAGPADEPALDRAAALYRAGVEATRALFFHQPGRLLRPGEAAEGLAAFAPFPNPPGNEGAKGSTYSAMQARYLAYREKVVAPFYRAHFRRFDAQIVLVDVLAALKAGQESFDDMGVAIAAILQSFDYGRSGVRGWLAGARTRRVLFAATKADHVSSNQHPNLRRLLEDVVSREANRIRFRGVETRALALSSVRCTEDVLGEVQGQTLSMVKGVPAGRGGAETALFPGEIPAHFPAARDWEDGRFRFLDFLPRPAATMRGLPHIGLDEAMESLIGERLR